MGLDFRKVASQSRLRAAEYIKKAEEALLHSDRRYFALMAQQWFVIAEGYEAHVLKRELVSVESRRRPASGIDRLYFAANQSHPVQELQSGIRIDQR